MSTGITVVPKRVIAICQYGGDFETNNDGSMLYGGGEAYAVDLEEQMQLSGFKQEIAEAIDSTVDGMLIKYFLPGNRKNLITVSKEKDFQRMVNYYKDSDQLEVFVMKEVAGAKNAKKKPVGRPPKRAADSDAIVVNATPASAVAAVPDLVPVNQMAFNEAIDMETTNEMSQIPVSALMIDGDQRVAAKQWENLITGVGQRFHTLADFREALRKYSIAHGFNYMYKKNENQRVTVKCKVESCPWRIHASRLATTQLVCIKTMKPNHNCQGVTVKPAFRATRSWVGNLIKEKVKDSPKIRPKDIAEEIKRDYGIELNYSQARRAKEYAREQLLGSYKDAYSELPTFCEKIMETNPGSLATLGTKEDSSFHRLFVSFSASILGFQQGCRPLLFLDSTPMNSKYQGVLLSATAADGNDGAFPVAFAVVDEETDDNWCWFLIELKSAVSTFRHMTFVSDFQKGLKNSIYEVFGGECYHAYCLGYLAEKLNKDLKGHFSHDARRLMVEDLYAAAHAPISKIFNKCTEDIKSISPEAFNWVINSEPEHWANAFFGGARYNHMTSNFGYLFYSWVSDANELPITHLIDDLRGKLMQLIYERRVDSSSWVTRLTPTMEEKLKNEAAKARSVQIGRSNGSKFEVQSLTTDVVDIDNWDCSCKGWLLTGLPCCHAIAVLDYLGRSPYDYCSRYFTVESYNLTYQESINPVPNLDRLLESEMDEASSIIVTPPPSIRSTPGRTKVRKDGPERVGPADFLKRQLQCGKCKGLGHNKRSCKEESGE